jgi:UDP-N-acetylmuramate dehydrogenase
MNADVDNVGQFHELRKNEPMAGHTTWRAGGRADLYFSPASVTELEAFLASVPEATPIIWLGFGSNVLVRDGGIRGVVIAMAGFEKTLERINGLRVRAGAGTSCARLARQCVRWQLGPAVFFAGIPGTVGGALAMNAGAFGGETWDNVESVTTIDRKGRLHERPRSAFEVAYRSVSGPGDEGFLAVTFRFNEDRSADLSQIKSLLSKRGETQPLGQASCGSVFRNPAGRFAGELIEAAGLKGRRVGGAVVSDKHANFIINDGAASAADIESLIGIVRVEVEKATGISLVPEVRIIGEPIGAVH